jgi:hypothetical protein
MSELFQIDSIKFNDKEVRRICDKNTNIEYYCLHDVKILIDNKSKKNSLFDQPPAGGSVKFMLKDTNNKDRKFNFIDQHILFDLFIKSKNPLCHVFIKNAFIMKSRLEIENRKSLLLIENTKEEIKSKNIVIQQKSREIERLSRKLNCTLFYVRCEECNKVIGKRRDEITDLVRKTIIIDIKKAFDRILYNAYKYNDERFEECFNNGHNLYYELTE